MGKPARTPPIPLDRLIALWKISLPVSIERELLSEISREHGVLQEARDLVEIIDRAWNEEVGSHFAAIHRIKLLLDEEPAVIARNLRAPKV
ncbi:Uncharacterised protein [Achromobacter denitrificans]|uniref:hypothetical protein n=1 Tax=Achromobacter denitrificans TaxID=32002 RepID=UPI000B1F5C72|nr:hypothetical protein [Achromobacter denitrificans]QKH45737.1 hypothetical protein FOC82_31295 [Achromobacter denitrificans]QKH52921.1 hypothetical protein FOC80_27175 [Achromobacter denitrificans]CAB3699534.1 hypothetical protein LMG1231_02518 [Achromobacter denitrificans]SUW33738.1 Uncharacterised protein [Achromobacter denitrificans]